MMAVTCPSCITGQVSSVVRQGSTTSGTATTYIQTFTTIRQFRQAWGAGGTTSATKQSAYPLNTINLWGASDYVLATDAPAGFTKTSTLWSRRRAALAPIRSLHRRGELMVETMTAPGSPCRNAVLVFGLPYGLDGAARPCSKRYAVALLVAAIAAVPVTAQMPMVSSGVPDLARVAAGYAADPHHTQIAWAINNLGFSVYDGIFGRVMATMVLDPAKPDATTVATEVLVSGPVTAVSVLDDHLKKADYFDVARFPTMTLKSTSVSVSGSNATIAGLLTLHGVIKPVTLTAHFIGAGTNPLSKKAPVGFAATATLKRSDFGMTTLLPALGDTVDLHINAAFERAG